MMSMRVRLSVLLPRTGPLFLNGNQKGVSSLKPKLMEVRLWNDQPNVVALVDHLDLKHTAHRIAYAIRRYKTCGSVEMKK